MVEFESYIETVERLRQQAHAAEVEARQWKSRYDDECRSRTVLQESSAEAESKVQSLTEQLAEATGLLRDARANMPEDSLEAACVDAFLCRAPAQAAEPGTVTASERHLCEQLAQEQVARKSAEAKIAQAAEPSRELIVARNSANRYAEAYAKSEAKLAAVTEEFNRLDRFWTDLRILYGQALLDAMGDDTGHVGAGENDLQEFTDRFSALRDLLAPSQGAAANGRCDDLVAETSRLRERVEQILSASGISAERADDAGRLARDIRKALISDPEPTT